MSPLLGSVTMTRTRPDGVTIPIVFELSQPERTPPELGLPDWYVTNRFLGLQDDDHVYAWFGEDPVEALALAICFAGDFLEGLPFASEIDYSNVPHFGFPILPLQRVVARPVTGQE